jgi:hypothetical protein
MMMNWSDASAISPPKPVCAGAMAVDSSRSRRSISAGSASRGESA